ncbi:VWA domain-containing protein [Parachlamydia sp. AcF125]|uniref:vWA domain-containing protein n=1 Tax=Parachlamydia sp. AcF125 TaxID=2795736 RepID=UPI001BC95221|nr:VWA domain-containing protein [Parachlamydia sp. AcF125]MBS4169069.1 hypothetical protein [Parachlamydia sp. AcF125]
MEDTSFEFSYLASLLAIVAWGILLSLWKNGKLPQKPRFFFSQVAAIKPLSSGWRVKYAEVPFWLKAISLAFLTLAWIDPHFYTLKPDLKAHRLDRTPREGIAIYLVLDQSGSMAQKITIDTEEKGRMSVSKIDFIREITRDFVKGNPAKGLAGLSHDLIGLIGFARAAQVLSPLTLDHQAILNQLDQFSTVKHSDEDGTSIGYAIFKTANLIASTKHFAQKLKEASPYTIKNAIMLIVTDGFQDPHPLDREDRYRSIELEDAAKYAEEQGVRVYIINVEPRIGSEECGSERRVMQKVAERTGGKFYLLDHMEDLKNVYADIDKLEKSVLPGWSKNDQPMYYQRFSLYPHLIAAGLACLFLAVLLEASLLRSAP